MEQFRRLQQVHRSTAVRVRQELELRALPNFELGMAGAAGELAGLGRVGMRHVSGQGGVCATCSG